MEEGEKFVTIARFPDETQAHMALASLKNRGIHSFVCDTHFTSRKWDYTDLAGSIKLLVPSSDVNKVMEILEYFDKNIDHETAHELVELKCPKCGSENIHYKKMSRGRLLLVAVLFMVPMLFMKKVCICFDCGHNWKDE